MTKNEREKQCQQRTFKPTWTFNEKGRNAKELKAERRNVKRAKKAD